MQANPYENSGDSFFRAKVSAAQEAIDRGRTIFLMANLATIIVLSANFNLYFTWMRYLVIRTVDSQYKPLLEAVQRARIEDTSIISVPLIGLKFSAGDVGLVSSLGMLVLVLWMYFAFRREQRLIGYLCQNLIEPEAEDTDVTTSAQPAVQRGGEILN